LKPGLRIAQITDCHLPADPGQTYRGIYPHDNLPDLLRKVRAWKPDLLLATGDLSEDGSPASYDALQLFFNALDLPVLALPGNHDDPVALAKTFPGSPVDSVQVTEHGNWQIVRLNSCIPGEPHGRIRESSLDELARVLEQDKGRPRLLAVHHQPLITDSPWIDKYRLFEPEAFLQMIDNCADVKAVVWGHIHQVFERLRSGTAMLGGPSSAINGIPGAQKFTPDATGPACRWLELEVGGTIETGIIYSKNG
jgi:Icc protein